MAKTVQPGLADALKAALTRREESLYAIAKRAGVSYPVLHRFVAGERGLTLETASKLARALGLSLEADVATQQQAESAAKAQLGRLLQRVYDGAIDQLVASAFSLRPPTKAELARLDKLIAEARKKQERSS